MNDSKSKATETWQGGKRPSLVYGRVPVSKGTRSQQIVRNYQLYKLKSFGPNLTKDIDGPKIASDFDGKFKKIIVEYFTEKIEAIANKGNNQYGIPEFDIENPPKSWPSEMTKGGHIFVKKALKEFATSIAKTGSFWVFEATKVANDALDQAIELLRPVANLASTNNVPGSFARSVTGKVRKALIGNFGINFEVFEENAQWATVQIYNALEELRFGRNGINAKELTYDFNGMFCSSAKAAYVYTWAPSTIVLCPFMFELSVPPWKAEIDLTTFASTLIHESAHRLGKPGDIYAEDNSREYKALGTALALMNADCYATFVMELRKEA